MKSTLSLLAAPEVVLMKTSGAANHGQFSVANLALAGFLLTNVLGEKLPSRH